LQEKNARDTKELRQLVSEGVQMEHMLKLLKSKQETKIQTLTEHLMKNQREINEIMKEYAAVRGE
jgi:hypothetical protein